MREVVCKECGTPRQALTIVGPEQVKLVFPNGNHVQGHTTIAALLSGWFDAHCEAAAEEGAEKEREAYLKVIGSTHASETASGGFRAGWLEACNVIHARIEVRGKQNTGED